MVIDWYYRDYNYAIESGRTYSVINALKDMHAISFFDLALIDGSEFTGMADLQLLIGASYIALDDVNTFKCYKAAQLLSSHPSYKLIYENRSLRNGSMIFQKKS